MTRRDPLAQFPIGQRVRIRPSKGCEIYQTGQGGNGVVREHIGHLPQEFGRLGTVVECPYLKGGAARCDAVAEGHPIAVRYARRIRALIWASGAHYAPDELEALP